MQIHLIDCYTNQESKVLTQKNAEKILNPLDKEIPASGRK